MAPMAPHKSFTAKAGSVHFSRYLIIAQKAMTENKKYDQG
jgi:hypothetical protein